MIPKRDRHQPIAILNVAKNGENQRVQKMQNLISKYGGEIAFKRMMHSFYEQVNHDRSVKHYFFGVDIHRLIANQLRLHSFLLRKLDHIYLQSPTQTALNAIRVRQTVFDDVMKHLELQLKKVGVNRRELPRMAWHIAELNEETRSIISDTTNNVCDAKDINLGFIDALIRKKGLYTKILSENELKILQGNGVAYPFWLEVDEQSHHVILIGKGLAYATAKKRELKNLIDLIQKRWIYAELEIEDYEFGHYLSIKHVIDYSGGDFPFRLFINLLKEFSWWLEDLWGTDKEDLLINLNSD